MENKNNSVDKAKEVYSKLIKLVKSGLESMREQTERWHFHPAGCAPTFADTEFYFDRAKSLAEKFNLLELETLGIVEDEIRHFKSKIVSSIDGKEQLTKAYEWINSVTRYGMDYMSMSAFVPS